MEEKKRRSKWWLLNLVSVISGLVLLSIVFLTSTATDINNAGMRLLNTVEYMKEQCNNSQLRDLASESKSLLRVSESIDMVRWRLNYGGETGEIETPGAPTEAELKMLASDSYLGGLILLDETGAVQAYYDTVGINPESLIAKMDSAALMDVIDFKEKTYAVRVINDDESHIDLAAVGRSDARGVIVGYYYTSAQFTRMFNNSIRTLVNGFAAEQDGTIVIADNNSIIASNAPELIDMDINTVPIIKRIMSEGTGTHLVREWDPQRLFGNEFGLMDKSRNYYIYAFMDERSVFATTPQSMGYALLLYVIFIVLLRTMRWRTAQTYERQQVEAQRQYTAELEQKNGQLHESAIQAQRANAAKSSFLSRMSHDIRTPLNGIIGLLNIDEAHFDDGELLRANHEKMMVSANHLLSLINDVLQMSKLEDGKVELTHEPVNLIVIAREVSVIISERAANAGIHFSDDVDPAHTPYPYVYASPLHLRQIFLNIYSNSIKYNVQGGYVTTHTECMGVANGRVTYRWTIADTGIGMSQEFLSHIFEPFSQERSDSRSVYQGTGLGMTIVKSLIDMMGGTISIDSREGKGSVFVITIPFDLAGEKDVLNPGMEQPTGSIAGLNMMLAEDNELNAEIAKTLLEDQGVHITVVGDGRQALDMFAKSEPGTFDAILMDIMMPVMDGITATREIRKLNRPDARTIPIIAMTANAFEEDAQKCLKAGMNAHLSKPLQISMVVATIARICGRGEE